MCQVEEHATVIIVEFPRGSVEVLYFRLLKQFLYKYIFRRFLDFLRQESCFIEPPCEGASCDERCACEGQNSVPKFVDALSMESMVHS